LEMLGMTDEDRQRLKGNGGGGREAPVIKAKWWPITESRPRYGVSPSTTRRLVGEELVEARKIGTRMLINDDSMGRYMNSQPRPCIKRDDRSAKLARRAA
jgi:hypothetical protein